MEKKERLLRKTIKYTKIPRRSHKHFKYPPVITITFTYTHARTTLSNRKKKKIMEENHRTVNVTIAMKKAWLISSV